MKHIRKGQNGYQSISRRVSQFCISFVAGLLLTFLILQGLLHYFAALTEKTLDTQEQFSAYWSELNELDLSLYAFSQTPAQELYYENLQTVQGLLQRAQLLKDTLPDPRGRDLFVVTEHLYELIKCQEEILNNSADTYSIAAAQTRIQMLQDLKAGFQEALQNYLRKWQQNQISARIIVSLLILLCCVVIIVFFVLKGRRLSGHILHPVLKLTDQAEKIIAGNNQIELNYFHNPEDELGILNNAFYGMLETNRNQMEQLKKQGKLEIKLANSRADFSELQAKLDRTKLRLLQSRVNPHFMFNTLNIIAGLAVEEDAYRTAKFVSKTAKYFRYSLVSLDKIVQLEEEIKNVCLYMEIQKERFRERVNWNFILPENCKHIPIPAMILQPLCENALIHGMGTNASPIEILISARLTDKKLYLSVSDDGTGMSAKLLEKLQQELLKWQTYDESRGIGIGNTFQRIQMFCDGNASFQANSSSLEGTTITFIIPEKEELLLEERI